MIEWDVKEIFNRLGGAKGVAAACARLAPHAATPEYFTIYMWKVRERISALWLPVLVAAAMETAISDNPDLLGLFVDVPEALLKMENCGL